MSDTPTHAHVLMDSARLSNNGKTVELDVIKTIERPDQAEQLQNEIASHYEDSWRRAVVMINE